MESMEAVSRIQRICGSVIDLIKDAAAGLIVIGVLILSILITYVADKYENR